MDTFSLRKKLLFNLFLVLTPILLAFIAGEIYIRFSKEYITPEILRQRSLQYEPARFARHVFPLKEQKIHYREWFINAKGYRGNDFSIKKKDGMRRVIVYGGSAAFDQNVPNGKDWPSRIEINLKEKGIRNIEVINAGIPGHTSSDSFGRLFAEGFKFEPDYLILYNAWNDIYSFSSEKSLLRRTITSYDKSNDVRVSYQGWADQFLCEISQLYVRLRSYYYHWKLRIGSEGSVESGEFNKEIGELGLKQYKLNIEMFVDLARNINAVPVLLTQARLIALDNTDEEKEMIRYDYQKMNHQTLLKAFEKTDEIIKEVSTSKNVSLIDISSKMSGHIDYFNDHVHLTDQGSMQLALLVSDYLFTHIREQKH